MCNDLISVIIPIYNAEKYLSRCLDSLLAQSYTNMEIILVNDGSIDNSGVISDEYAKKDNRIKVIHKDNGGAAQARNVAIKIAKGEWIAFVDADDSVSCEFLQEMHQNAVNYNAEISCCKLLKTDNIELDYNTLNRESPKEIVLSGSRACEYLHRQTDALITQTLVNRIYKATMFSNIKIPEGNMCEDEAIIYKLLYSCNNVVASYKVLYAYFQTPDSVMRASFSKRHLVYLDILEERLMFYKEKKEKTLWELTLKNKCYALQNYYYKCKETYPQEKELYKKMRVEFLKTFPLAIKSKAIPLKSKICLIAMRIWPKAYNRMRE